MGSVISSCECPHCKGEANEDFYYKTGEVYIMCSCCGYYLSHILDREKLEKDGKHLLSEITEDYWIKEEVIPVANYYEQFKEFGRSSTISEGTVEEILENLQSNRDTIIDEETYENILVNWYDGKRHYQFDLNRNTSEEVMLEPVLDSAGFDKEGNNHYQPNRL